MRFHCINDRVPSATIDLLRQACQARDIEMVEHHAPDFEYLPEQVAHSGELLYRPATSQAAEHVEQFMLQRGVASFYAQERGALQLINNPWRAFAHAGLSIPRHFPVHTADRDLVRQWVERLGGLPVVVKFPGFSGGTGVLRADSLAALYSLLDYALATGRSPLLMSYVDEAVHWRVVVVGARAVAAYRNPKDEDDFRSFGSEDPLDCTEHVPDDLARLAIKAVQCLGLELGGVDILRHASGRLYLLEANFPLYHAHAELVAGIPVSGHMIDHLVAKARRLSGHSLSHHCRHALESAGARMLSNSPLLGVIDAFVSEGERALLLDLIEDAAWLSKHGITMKEDATGRSCELPITAHPVLAHLATRGQRALGLPNHLGQTLRSEADGHGHHLPQ
jgi:RimK-like ATP-grasp domain